MTPEQNFKFRSLLSNLLNARAMGESDERQLAHEDHLRNWVTGLLEEKESEITRLETRLRHIKALVTAPPDTEDERHVHMKITKAKPAPISFLDIEDDEMLDPITEEFLDAMSEAWADGVGSGLYDAMKRFHSDELLIPQIARLIDESDWPLSDRLARAHKAYMLQWEGKAYEGRHAPKTTPCPACNGQGMRWGVDAGFQCKRCKGTGRI